MKRLLFIAAFVLTVGVLAGTASAAGPPSVRVVEAKGPAFPVRTYVLTLKAGRGLTMHDVRVTENGDDVLRPSLVPASAASEKTFGVVLVLDTSYSMKGKPLAAAISAAQAFAFQRNKNEQLGIIEFNQDETVALPLTTSVSKINAALATIRSKPRFRKRLHPSSGVSERLIVGRPSRSSTRERSTMNCSRSGTT